MEKIDKKSEMPSLGTLRDRLSFAIARSRMQKGEIAAKLGVDPTYISRWLRGSSISAKYAKQTADILGVPLEWLLAGIGDFKQPEGSGNVVVLDNDGPLPYDVIKIPEYHVSFCCGGGAYEPNIEAVENSLPAFYRRSWCEAKGLNPKDLIRVKAVGDSMEPTIMENDYILIDTSAASKEYRVPNRIYAFISDGMLVLKRIRRREDGMIELLADNPDYDKVTMTESEFNEKIYVIGRAVERSGSLW